MISNSNDPVLQLFCIMVYTVSAALVLLLAGRAVLLSRRIRRNVYKS